MMRLPEFEDCRDLEQLNGGDYFHKRSLSAMPPTIQTVL